MLNIIVNVILYHMSFFNLKSIILRSEKTNLLLIDYNKIMDKYTITSIFFIEKTEEL